MLNITKNKIPTLWLLIGLVTEIGYASQGEIFADRATASTYIAFSNMPRAGQIFTVTYTIIPRIDSRGYYYPYVVQFWINTFQEKGAYKIVEGKLEYPLPVELKKDVPVTFSISLLITKAVPIVKIGAGIPGHIAWYRFLEVYLIDPQTGQYGTKEEWLKRAINVFWKYNNVEPQWLLEPDQTWEASNRKIAEEMRRFEPSLSDSEALCLHQDNYLLIINAIGEATSSDSERISHLLKAGWLKAQRAGTEAKEKWFKDFTEKNKGRWGGNPNPNLFRGDSNYHNLCNGCYWKSKEDLCNKEQGLLADAIKKAVKGAKARLNITYQINQLVKFSSVGGH